MDEALFLDSIRGLRVYERSGRRAPHKPLLLLLALGRLQRTGSSRMRYVEVQDELLPLLKMYAPPVKARHQPELPYWHLRSSEIWELTEGDALPRQSGGFPRMGALSQTQGSLRPEVESFLSQNPRVIRDAIAVLLDTHFAESLHEDILDATGTSSEQIRGRGQSVRDPNFRREVMRAYEHRCVATGVRLALAGSFLGLDAAHIRSHRFGGPGHVQNGLALTPTLHRLFDHGAWSLTDHRVIIVSAELVGGDGVIENLRTLHGRPIREPITAAARASPEYIRWHREPELGGIFRTPALDC